jgi:hypothetical protein
MPSETNTNDMINGRMWINSDRSDKIMYLSGYVDVIQYEEILKRTRYYRGAWDFKYTIDDYIRELDAFYQPIENVRIPVVMALDYITFKLSPKHTKAEVESRLLGIRKLTAAFP